MMSCCNNTDVVIKPIRKVVFAKEETHFAPRCRDDDDRELTEFWYSEADILSFRADARDTCRKFNQCNGVGQEVEELCLQGLGFLLSNERKQNRVLANRGIMKTQKCCCKNQDLIATIAEELTAWAKEVASCTAILNYYEIYFPQRCTEQLLQQKVTVPCPLSALRKRLNNSTTTGNNNVDNGESNNNQRCVRQCRRGPLEVHV